MPRWLALPVSALAIVLVTGASPLFARDTTPAAVSSENNEGIAVPAPPPFGDLPSATPAEMADFRSQVDALYRLKEKAFARQDPATIVNQFYSKDAISFGPEGKPVIGRAEFAKEYAEVVKLGVPKIEPVYTHVGKDAAWEWVNFRVHLNDPDKKDFTFIMLFVFAKQNGKWYCGGHAYTVGEFHLIDKVKSCIVVGL